MSVARQPQTYFCLDFTVMLDFTMTLQLGAAMKLVDASFNALLIKICGIVPVEDKEHGVWLPFGVGRLQLRCYPPLGTDCECKEHLS